MHGTFVTLERMTDDDYELLATWAASVVGSYSSSSQDFLSGTDLKRLTGSGVTYLMVCDSAAKRVGAVNYRPVTYPGSYDIGVAIGHPELWTHGHGIDAAMALMTYLFHSRNAHRIQLTMGAYNLRMMQVLGAGALTLEGVLRDYFYLDGEYHDGVIGSLLRDEFYALSAAGDYGYLDDSVPAAEKAEARRLLREHIAAVGGHHLASLARGDAPPHPSDAPNGRTGVIR